MNAMFKEIDLVVVGDKQCPTTKTYLTYLYHHGIKPSILLLVDFLYSQPSNPLIKKMGRWGNKLYKLRVNTRVPGYSTLFMDISQTIQEKFIYPIPLFESFDYKKYVNKVIEYKAIDYCDKDFQHLLFKLKKKYFLYTGGGMVPATLLNSDDFKMFHIHPGIVPNVRGSDGLFWSILTREKIGASCFFMDPNIDTGDLIFQQEYEIIRMPELRKFLKDSLNDLRTALLWSYDPHFRAMTFIESLKKFNFQVDQVSSSQQTSERARSYYRMHDKILYKLFSEFLFV